MGIEGLEMTTLSLFLKKRITRVYDVDFLVQTTRPFAKWELAETVTFASPKDVGAGRKAGEPGEEETVAETVAADGEVTGRWIVTWEEGGVGRCRKVGSMVRYVNFNSTNILHNNHSMLQSFQCARGALDVTFPVSQFSCLLIVIYGGFWIMCSIIKSPFPFLPESQVEVRLEELFPPILANNNKSRIKWQRVYFGIIMSKTSKI